MDQCEGTKSLVAIRRVFRELFTKNHREGVRSTPPPLQVRGLNWISLSFSRGEQHARFYHGALAQLRAKRVGGRISPRANEGSEMTSSCEG